MQESVDATGKYIAVSGTEHIDHGTAVMKDGKACFTSAMNKEGEVCWTDPMLAEGRRVKPPATRARSSPSNALAYVPLTM